MTNFIPHQYGIQAEYKACEFLKNQGLQFVTKNFRTPLGEIDLIMQDQEVLVFVEVRLRKNLGFGLGADSISSSKKKKLIQTATIYLQREKLLEKIACRFDVIAMTLVDKEIDKRVLWIRDAFQVE